MLGPPLTSVEAELSGRFSERTVRLARGFGPLYGILVCLVARRFERVALVKGTVGVVTVAVVETLRRSRRLIVLEMIDREPPAHPLRGAIYRAWSRLIERPAIGAAMAVGHVLTRSELELYADRYRVEPNRLSYVPWALLRERPTEFPDPREGRGVFASGRAYCDWETTFAAARAGDWELTVACGDADRERIERLNADGFAEVHCELQRVTHDLLLRKAAVYVLVLEPVEVSAGHVRLLAATGAGVPVVSTRAEALTDYVEPGVSCLEVACRDPEALAEAVEGLLADPSRRRSLRDGAIDRGQGWLYRDFFAAMGDLIAGRLPEVPAMLGSSSCEGAAPGRPGLAD